MTLCNPCFINILYIKYTSKCTHLIYVFAFVLRKEMKDVKM